MTEETISVTIPGEDKVAYDRGKIRRDLLIRRIGRIGLLFNPLLVYVFLWIPITVLVIFSFNNADSLAEWRGFSTRWYENIINNTLAAGTETPRFTTKLMLKAVENTLIVSISATVVSTVFGTMVALSLVRGRFPGKQVLDAVLHLPIVIPDITQGISLAIFFKIIFDFWAGQTGQRLTNSLFTIIIAHIAFNISFVAIVVRARLTAMNPHLEEAARDLGANEWKTFWRITFPQLLPGIVAGALLAFTLSLDDFVITFFMSGVGTTTLPIFVYGMLKQRVPPEINAISTLMLLASIILVGTSLVLQSRNTNRD